MGLPKGGFISLNLIYSGYSYAPFSAYFATIYYFNRLQLTFEKEVINGGFFWIGSPYVVTFFCIQGFPKRVNLKGFGLPRCALDFWSVVFFYEYQEGMIGVNYKQQLLLGLSPPRELRRFNLSTLPSKLSKVTKSNCLRFLKINYFHLKNYVFFVIPLLFLQHQHREHIS